jgi:hypothetical protein
LDELQKITEDPDSQAVLLTDKAWMVMEAAREPEKYGGNQEDARKMMEKVLTLTDPNEDPRTCALAELMYMESYAYEHKPEIAIQLAQQLVEKYPNRLREKCMALIFLGVLEYQRGNLQTGYDWLEKVHQQGLEPQNQAPFSFGRIFPLRHSAVWLRTIARDLNRQDLVDYWDSYIKQNW